MKSIDWKAYLALATICIVWGTTYLVLRVGVELVPPFLFTGIRQTIAGLALTAGMMLFFSNHLPEWRIVMRHAIVGFFMISIGNGAVGWAEMYVTSSIAAIICSLMPLWIILINLAYGKGDKVDGQILFGVLLGFGGLMLIFNDNLGDFANSNYTVGIVVIFLATISWAAGTIYLRTFKRNGTPLLDAGLQMFFGGFFLLLLSAFTEDANTAIWNGESMFALIYLIVMGSAVAYGAYSFVLTRLPTPVVSLYAYINPVVAVILGWFILDEKLNFVIMVGCLIIVAGVYIVNTGYRKQELRKMLTTSVTTPINPEMTTAMTSAEVIPIYDQPTPLENELKS
jgi:drug/metabolite transporter (DMT)-like permease